MRLETVVQYAPFRVVKLTRKGFLLPPFHGKIRSNTGSDLIDMYPYLYSHNYNFPSPCGVYAIVNVQQGRAYIGSSNNLTYRVGQHFKALELGVHTNRDFQYSFNNYGPTAFSVVILEHCAEEDLTEREQTWLNRLRPIALNHSFKAVRPKDLRNATATQAV